MAAVKGSRAKRFAFGLLFSSLLSLIIVAAGTLAYLSAGLPDETPGAFRVPATDFNFAFGSGHVESGHMAVDGFADGYALLTSGPVTIHADSHHVLRYTWLPPNTTTEAAFFWRLKDNPNDVLRTNITLTGSHFIDLSGDPGWSGDITEIGFLISGDNGSVIMVGPASLEPESLEIRLQLMWNAWTTFEKWSQQSINFLNGGKHDQVIPLPLLVIAWLVFSLLLFWLNSRFDRGRGPTEGFRATAILFLVAWMLLDVRWTANNMMQTRHSLQHNWQMDEQHRLYNLDGEFYRYIQRINHEVFGNGVARILVIGGENGIDYYLSRAKYYLLPHSVNVASRFDGSLQPENLDFVIILGPPGGIESVPGWK